MAETFCASFSSSSGEVHFRDMQDLVCDCTIFIGEWMDQGQAGVCRHRSLLFKIMADEAGLKSALVRGNYAGKAGPPGFPHAWNELWLEDGRRVLVDVMHKRGEQTFPELSSPEVVSRYLRVNDKPWYAVKAKQAQMEPEERPYPVPRSIRAHPLRSSEGRWAHLGRASVERFQRSRLFHALPRVALAARADPGLCYATPSA